MIYPKRKRGNPTIAHPAYRGSRIAHHPRISNAEAHAVLIYYKIIMYNKNHGTLTLLYPVSSGIEFARFGVPQIKRLVQRLFLYMFVAHLFTR